MHLLFVSPSTLSLNSLYLCCYVDIQTNDINRSSTWLLQSEFGNKTVTNICNINNGNFNEVVSSSRIDTIIIILFIVDKYLLRDKYFAQR